jgi:ATP synthase protein I
VNGVGLFNVVRRVLQLQLLTILFAFAITWGISDREHGVSALLGGFIGFAPNVLFAFIFGRRDPRKSAHQVVSAFYFGEISKLILTALLFVIVFQLPGIWPLPLLATFGAVMMVFWFALLLRSN